jgi:hypothetical protein
MPSITKIVIALAASIILSFAAQAHEQTLKPMQGASFNAGTKHAAVYFLANATTCQLVVTAADDADYAPSRVETLIAAGAFANYPLSEGTTLRFGCAARGESLTIRALETFVAN